MKVRVDSVDNEVLKTSIIDTLKEVMKHLEAEDMDFVQDETIKFCKNQKLKGAIMESVNLLQQGAMKAGADRDIGHEYMSMIDDRFTETTRKTVPTGWDVIDDLMDGGLGPGELGVFVAPAGIGKSWALVNAAAKCFICWVKI